MTGFRVVLDACVLVPISKADLLLTFAEHHAYRPLWSNRILDEVAHAIPLATRGRTTYAKARQRGEQMNYAFEDALIEGWEPLENAIVGLLDDNDRHVVATAVRGNASAIVPDNPKDFPDDALAPLGLHKRTSDQFLLDLMYRNPARAVACVAQTADKRQNPPISTEGFLDALGRSGASRFASAMRELF